MQVMLRSLPFDLKKIGFLYDNEALASIGAKALRLINDNQVKEIGDPDDNVRRFHVQSQSQYKRKQASKDKVADEAAPFVYEVTATRKQRKQAIYYLYNIDDGSGGAIPCSQIVAVAALLKDGVGLAETWLQRETNGFKLMNFNGDTGTQNTAGRKPGTKKRRMRKQGLNVLDESFDMDDKKVRKRAQRYAKFSTKALRQELARRNIIPRRTQAEQIAQLMCNDEEAEAKAIKGIIYHVLL